MLRAKRPVSLATAEGSRFAPNRRSGGSKRAAAKKRYRSIRRRARDGDFPVKRRLRKFNRLFQAMPRFDKT